METLILTLDTVAFVVILYFSYKGEREPGQPELGPFRIRNPRTADPRPDPPTTRVSPTSRRVSRPLPRPVRPR